MEQHPQESPLTIPTAIVIAGIIIAGSIFFTRGVPDVPNRNNGNTKGLGTENIAIRPLDSTDHIQGNPNAKVIIVEYSDPECPFCKQFHGTMKAIMNTYKNGEVAWVYRQLPLPELHPKGPHEAEAMECATELGGNDAFWKYADRLFEITPANNGLDPAELPEIASYIGLDKQKFITCQDSGKTKARVDNDAQDARNAGADGTPFNILLVTKTGEKIAIHGAQPYNILKNAIDGVLKK